MMLSPIVKIENYEIGCGCIDDFPMKMGQGKFLVKMNVEAITRKSCVPPQTMFYFGMR